MTAISVFCTNSEAYLMADQGFFSSETGALVGHQSKAVSFKNERIALALSGSGDLSDLFAAMDATLNEGWTQSDLLAALPDILRKLHSAMVLHHGINAVTRIFGAMFDTTARQPKAFCISSDQPDFLPSAKQFQVVELEGVAVPPVDFAALFPEGYISHPRKGAAKIIKAQRAFRFDSLAGAHGVSGDIELHTVSKRGVKMNVVARFTDKIGERIKL